MKHKKADWIHQEYPKTCSPHDFWGQVKRSVNGKAVSQEQIDMIVGSIHSGLRFKKSDVLLDIGCGNGALTRYFTDHCASILGVDYSSFLIQVAKANFEHPPSLVFAEMDAVAYLQRESDPSRFTKALCYGTFSYFPETSVRGVLTALSEKFINISTLYIGNLPDRDRIQNFFYPNIDYTPLVKDPTSPIGIWWSQAELRQFATESGWRTQFYLPPKDFYAAHYRYDAILTRRVDQNRVGTK